MGNEDFEVNFEQMDAMVAVFRKAAEQFDATIARVQNVANELEGGALLGRAGNTLVTGLREKYARSLSTSQVKMTEMAADIIQFVNDVHDQDKGISSSLNI